MARRRPPEAPAESKPRTRGTPTPAAPLPAPAPKAPKPAPKRNKRTAVPPPPPPPPPPPEPGEVLLTAEQAAELKLLEQEGYATISERRAKVARYRAQKLTLKEIANALGVGTTTIFRDLRALDVEWMKEARGERDPHRARELAELQAMERQAATAYGASQSEEARIRWLDVRLRIKARVSALLGLDAAVSVRLGGHDGGPLEITDARSPAGRLEALAALYDSVRARVDGQAPAGAGGEAADR